MKTFAPINVIVHYPTTEEVLASLCKCLKDKCAWYDKETYDKPMCIILAMK